MFKCIRCWVEKEKICFYSHPETIDWISHKCKECCKEACRWKYNPSYEVERNKNPKRKEYKKKYLKDFRKENPEKWNAQKLVNNFLRYRPELKPKKSLVSGETGIIHLHHFDYSKPFEVIPCTPKEHKQFHLSELHVKPEFILKLK